MLGGPGPHCGGEYTEEMLELHNRYREAHGATKLKISKKVFFYKNVWKNEKCSKISLKLTEDAQKHADMLAAEDRFQHDLGTEQGENLYAGTAVEVYRRCVCRFFP